MFAPSFSLLVMMVFLQIILEHKFHCLLLLDVLPYVATASSKFRTDQWTSHLPRWVALPYRVLKDGFEYPSKEPFLCLLKIYLSDAYLLIAFLVAIPTSLTNWAFFMPTGRIKRLHISHDNLTLGFCSSTVLPKKEGGAAFAIPPFSTSRRRQRGVFFESSLDYAWSLPKSLPSLFW